MTTRRDFIHKGLIIGAAGLVVSACGRGEHGVAALTDADLDAAAMQIQGFDADKLPARPDLATVRKSLRDSLAPVLPNADSLSDAIGMAVRSDYEQGRIVVLDGWMLSRTEGHLLDYSALLHASAGKSTLTVTPAADAAKSGTIVGVKAWGPMSTCAGQGFNVQSDGHSSLWISVADDAPAGLKVLLNGTTIPTTQSSGIMTTRIAGDNFDRLFTRRGKIEVALFNPHQGTKQVIGQFMVNDPGAFATTQSGKPSTVFHQVSDWGPKATPVSTPFNPQQDNRSAFWIKSACAPPRTMARLGDVELQVMVSAEIITAKLGGIDALKVKGPLPLTLFDPVTQDSVLVGEFLVGE